MSNFSKTINILMEFSLPLIFGVIAALVAANWDYHAYHVIVDYPVFGEGAEILGHPITAHFLINDIFMVFFFGLCAKEVTEACLPGGSLNPLRKAMRVSGVGGRRSCLRGGFFCPNPMNLGAKYQEPSGAIPPRCHTLPVQ